MRTVTSIITAGAGALGIVCTVLGPVAAQRGPSVPPLIKEGITEKISEHVYVIPDQNTPVVPNVGIIVGSRGTFVIDTGLGARNGQAIMREVGKVSRNSERYLATTHFHPEHDLGAQGFPASTKMLRSRDQQADIDEFGLQMAKTFSGFSPLNAELLQGAEFRKADIHFDREHTIDLGGVTVRLMAMGANHTRGDTAFFVEPDGILFSGDIVMMALPGLGSPHSRVSIWLQSLDRFEKLQPKRIVPSHGPMGDASMIANYRSFLTIVRARAVALKKEGKSLDDTVRAIQTELQATYSPPNRMVSAIRAAYNEAP
jgi:glyoxylase-like metal-dependent hydrolase (beta-lactamase superfamily II)